MDSLKSRLSRRLQKYSKYFPRRGSDVAVDFEALTDEKRLSYLLHHSGQQEPVRLDEGPLFEDFMVVGLAKGTSLKPDQASVYEPQLLFHYPGDKALEVHELSSFCFPNGIRMQFIERTPSASDLLELLFKPTYQRTTQHVFVLTTERGPLYGVCLTVLDLFDHSTTFFASQSPGARKRGSVSSSSSRGGSALDSSPPQGMPSRYVCFAPMCYCMLTRKPFFSLQFAIMDGILSTEHLKRVNSAITTEVIGSSPAYKVDLSPARPPLRSRSETPTRSSSDAVPGDGVKPTRLSFSSMTRRRFRTASTPPRVLFRTEPTAATETTTAADSSATAAPGSPPSSVLASPSSCGTPSGLGLTPSSVRSRTDSAQSVPSAVSSEGGHLCEGDVTSTSSDAGEGDNDDDEDVFRSIDDFQRYTDSMPAPDATTPDAPRPLARSESTVSNASSASSTHNLQRIKDVVHMLHELRLVQIPGSGEVLSFRNQACDISHNFLVPSSDDPEAELLARFGVSGLFTHLSLDTILQALVYIMLERRVLFVSSDPSRLSEVILGLQPLMRPFIYPMPFIPVLPTRLLSVLDAPVPFVVGVTTHPPDSKKIDVIVYIDEDRIKVNGASAKFPRKQILVDKVRALQRCLRNNSLGNDGATLTRQERQSIVDSIVECFRAHWETLFATLSNYSVTNITDTDNPISVFLPDTFLKEVVASEDRPFVSQFLETQQFSQFSEQRLEESTRKAMFERAKVVADAANVPVSSTLLDVPASPLRRSTSPLPRSRSSTL